MSTASKKIDLTKLANRTKSVQISVGSVDVSHLSIGDIASIMIRFPQIAEVFSSSEGGVGLSSLAGSVPEAIPYAIALGTIRKDFSGESSSSSRDDQIRATVSGVLSLTAEDQLKLLAAIFEISFPGGLASFFETLAAAMNGVAKTTTQDRGK